ncbi:hypothetical protein OG393_33365 (plasmid) [Streptomyces sp. NBC_01216]|uniref:hypothetical protein n=1 Tax=Streptomyces sp. NBC_01216 TaxID=2903778 RepID=UPI002E0DA85C|nr:hypothetical protein OG393_33365 [Streptomyces sp. NBC_01216]
MEELPDHLVINLVRQGANQLVQVVDVVRPDRDRVDRGAGERERLAVSPAVGGRSGSVVDGTERVAEALDSSSS